MSRNAISFFFKLGKHQPLKFRPLIELKADVAVPSALLPGPTITRKSPVKIEQVQHTNQMSS